MSFANEVARSLASALGILRYEPSALEGFKLEWRRFRDAVDHFVERTESK